MAGLEDDLQGALRGRHPLIALRTWEEDRALCALRSVAAARFGEGSLTTWSCVRGLEPAGQGGDAKDPVAALQELVERPRRGFSVMRDLGPFFGDPRVRRALREAAFAFRRHEGSVLVLLGSSGELPEELERHACVIEAALPSADDLLAELAEVERDYPAVALTEGLRSRISLALRGLTIDEAGHVLHRAFAGEAGKADILKEIFAEKERRAGRAAFLEHVPVEFDLGRLGGLENAKDWAARRKGLFTRDAVSAGSPIPKGVLIMGVSGCGKSMLAKAIAGSWKVPLFRLDMSLVFSGAFGSPQAAFHRALRTAEALAPLVLWIDEMEASLGSPKEGGTAQSMTFSAFLTWMQEKPPLVFVAATANRIEDLPAEVIRKGRFDEVFFVDLPTKEEREQIVNLLLEAHGPRPEDLDMDRLVYRTAGWSGAELEQAVIAARLEAQQKGRPMRLEDLLRQTDQMIPLSKTMASQVKAIRDWAHERAVRASRQEADSSA